MAQKADDKPAEGFWRVCDANLNRAREGLRVCEEVARFVLQESELTHQCQTLRRRLGRLASRFPRERLVSNRDARRDVGIQKKTTVRRHRGYPALIRANARRTQEALRVLEEFARLQSVQKSHAFSRVRFGVYRFEQTLLSRLSALRHR